MVVDHLLLRRPGQHNGERAEQPEDHAEQLLHQRTASNHAAELEALGHVGPVALGIERHAQRDRAAEVDHPVRLLLDHVGAGVGGFDGSRGGSVQK